MTLKIGTDGRVIGDIKFIANCLDRCKKDYQVMNGEITNVVFGREFDNYNVSIENIGFSNLVVQKELRPSICNILGVCDESSLNGVGVSAYIHDGLLKGISRLVSEK